MNKTQFYLNLIAQFDRVLSFVDQSIEGKLIDESENIIMLRTFLTDSKMVFAKDLLKSLHVSNGVSPTCKSDEK